MPPKFGTSGLRGLVTELTPELVGAHVAAFLAGCDWGTGLFVGRDLRPSSPDIADTIIKSARACGVPVTDCGAVPTPALALAAMKARAGAVMITGSHIPADRNGLKFYTPAGEITKEHEAIILSELGKDRIKTGSDAPSVGNDTAGPAYVARYVDAFGVDALSGMRVGVYSHSTVGRDLLIQILRDLGAEVMELGRSEDFIPVDTEAVDDATRGVLRDWAQAHDLTAILSMDGDGDRPLLTDAQGEVIPGDVLGQITGGWLGAAVAVTPVSSNTGAEAVFDRVVRTKIGSPYVIAGMEDSGGDVVGYEANGGFLLGFEAKGLSALMTRDSVLPMMVPLIMAKEAGGMTQVLAAQPHRFTAADRVQDVPTEASKALIAKLSSDADALAGFVAQFDGQVGGADQTDGLRITLSDHRIVHLRPSGNAPECRLYAEADSPDAAAEMLTKGMGVLKGALLT